MLQKTKGNDKVLTTREGKWNIYKGMQLSRQPISQEEWSKIKDIGMLLSECLETTIVGWEFYT